MSESLEQSLPDGFVQGSGAAPRGPLETRRERRARIEALEASLRRGFVDTDAPSARASTRGSITQIARVEASGVVFTDENGVVFREPWRA